MIDSVRGEDVLQNLTQSVGRGGASHCNQEEKGRRNAVFDHVLVKATRTIWHCEDTLVNYGNDYWKL